MSGTIPVRIANFNIYRGANKIVGVTGEVKLPNLDALSETVDGAGILGEIDVANPGHFPALPIEIPFRTLDGEIFDLFKNDGETVVLRGAAQLMDTQTSKLTHKPVKVTIKGPRKGNDLGSMAVGKPSASKITIDAWYLKVEIDGETSVELDKLNFVYILNGEDQLADLTPLL